MAGIEVALGTTDKAQQPETSGDVTVYVTYDVRVTCPHCNKDLHLNQYPYDDTDTPYSAITDDLGMAVFGSFTVPARWTDLSLKVTCMTCKKKFTVRWLQT